MQQFRGIENVALAQFRSDDALVGERAGRARDHALAAGNARRLAHRQVVIEGDAGLISLAAAGQHPVVPDIVAAANAAVAQDAGLVIHRDHRRGIVLAARRGAAREAGLGDPRSGRQTFQFAIARVQLPGAGRGMVRHQQFDQGVPRALHLLGRRLHRHAGFRLSNAGRGIHALPHIDHAHPAHADRIFILLMAKRGNRDAVDAGRVEDRGPGRDRNLLAIDGQLNFGRRPGTHAVPRFGTQTPAGQRLFLTCSSTTWGKCFSTDWMGAGTICPRPQIEVSFIANESSSSRCKSEVDARPSVHPVSISTIFCEPTRQGTHLPQDSLR